MSVFKDKRRSGRWSYDFWLSGKRYQGYCVDPSTGEPVRNRRDAQEIEADRRKSARAEQKLHASGMRAGQYTLNQACAQYLARKQETEPSNFDNHVLYVREIRGFLNGHRPMADISTEDVEVYRRFCGSQTLKVWTGGPTRTKDDARADRYWKETGRIRSKRQVNNYLKCLRALFEVAAKVRDPMTRLPILQTVPEIGLHRVPKRLPRPIGDAELVARLETAPPWTREAAELSRLFGLRHGEAFWVERRHIDYDARAIRFGSNETKSNNEELAYGGETGWRLLQELAAQAVERGQHRLVTWPGKKHFRALLAGRQVPGDCWQPLKSIRKSWQAAARRAGIEQPHRFHDVRARYITEVAKILPAAAQDAARHQDPSTTAMYIKLATNEVRDAVHRAVERRPKIPGKLRQVK